MKFECSIVAVDVRMYIDICDKFSSFLCCDSTADVFECSSLMRCCLIERFTF